MTELSEDKAGVWEPGRGTSSDQVIFLMVMLLVPGYGVSV